MRKVWQALGISLALGIISLILVLPDSFSQATLAAIKSMRVGYLGIAVLLILGWWLLAGYRFRMLAGYAGYAFSLWRGVQTHIVGVFSSAVTPAGGGNSFGVAWILTRFGLPLDTAAAMTVLILVGDTVFFAWAIPLSFGFLLFYGIDLPIKHIGLLIMALSIGSLTVSFLIIFRLRYATALLKRLAGLNFLSRFKDRIAKFADELQVASESYASMPWTHHLGFHALSALSRLCYFGFLNCVLLALNVSIIQVVVLAVQIIIHAFAFAIPTPGASGYQEAALTFALKGDIQQSTLSAAVIIWRFAHYYLYFFLGPLVGGLTLFNKSQKDTLTSKAE